MTIGQLYNAAGVVIGQAATLFAPKNTPLPAPIQFNATLADPFSLAPWVAVPLTASATITAGSYVLTYTFNGTTYSVASQTATTGTASALAAAIVTALAPAGATATDVVVSGGPVSAVATPMLISLSESFSGGVWGITPTGITGGTLALGQGLWTPAGGTDNGWKFGANKSTTDQFIEEQSTPIDTTMGTQKVTIDGSLAEDISKTLALAYNGSVAVTAPTTGVPGYEDVVLTDTVQHYAIAMITRHFNGMPRVYYAPDWTQLTNTTTDFRRAAGKRMYPVQFSTVCAISAIKIRSFTSVGS